MHHHPKKFKKLANVYSFSLEHCLPGGDFKPFCKVSTVVTSTLNNQHGSYVLTAIGGLLIVTLAPGVILLPNGFLRARDAVQR